jgi:ferredoxin-NADP reductase
LDTSPQAQYPFEKKMISMIAGGTGITPMFQALERIVNTEGAPII